MSTETVNIINTDMTKEMKSEAIDCVKAGIMKAKTDREIAIFVKRYFDQAYETSWSCIVGKNFGSYVSHKPTKHIFFYIGDKGVLLFQTD